VLARLRNLSRTLTASPFPHRSWEEAQRVSLLLRMLFYGSAISPIILTLHYVTGTYVPVISYEADMFIVSLSWAGLYLLARTRYPRIALYASSLLTILILLSAYLHGNSWALFYFVPALVATAFMVPPLPVALIASGYLGMTLWFSKGSDAFPIAPLIILVTASIALMSPLQKGSPSRRILLLSNFCDHSHNPIPTSNLSQYPPQIGEILI
jgi:hypothetical protein